VCWTLKRGLDARFSLFDLSDRMRMQGWQVAAYTLPPDLQAMPVMRALVRHGFSRDMADRFIEDLRKALDYFKQHPMEHPSGADEGSSDPHSGVAQR
jgi:glutamate decarboxylase